MESVVITLTCPQCGGQMHGIEATDVDHNVTCTYCGTELHIPKIGGDVVHERVVVVERTGTTPPSAPVSDVSPLPESYMPPDDSADTSTWRGALAIAVGVAVLLVGVFWFLRRGAADAEQQWRDEEQAQKECKDGCVRACRDNRDAYKGVGHLELRDDDSAVGIDDTIKGFNLDDCQSTCEEKKKCYARRTR